MVDELKEKGLLVESQGAQVVKLDEYGMPPCMILKSDGTSLYCDARHGGGDLPQKNV